VKDLAIFVINEISMAVKPVEMLGLQLPLGQKTEDRTCLLLGLSGQQKTLRDARRRQVNRSSVLVVVTHELFAAPQYAFLGILEPAGNLTLKE
jgi:hypothetical protein